MTLSAQEIYQTQVRQLPLPERLRLAALLLDDLQTLPPLASALSAADAAPARPRRGSGKHDISFMADDFDEPLDDMREYSERIYNSIYTM